MTGEIGCGKVIVCDARLFVSANLTEGTRVEVTLTLYDPAVALAVAVTEVVPSAAVTAGVDKAALAPVDCAVKVTVAPLTRLPNWSFTTTCNGAAKAVFTVAL